MQAKTNNTAAGDHKQQQNNTDNQFFPVFFHSNPLAITSIILKKQPY